MRMSKPTILTEKQKEILKLKLEGRSNGEIAKKLSVSDEYISQTLKLVSGKIQTVKDSIELFTDLGLMESGPVFRLSEEGMNALRARRTRHSHFVTTVAFPKRSVILNAVAKKPCLRLCPYVNNSISPRALRRLGKQVFPIAKIGTQATMTCVPHYSKEIERCG